MESNQRHTVLVTGGSGFVGAHVVRRLIRSGYRVIATTTGRGHGAENGDAEWVRWDAGEGAIPNVDWSRVDAVAHLAKASEPFDFPACAESNYRISITATYRMLEAARYHGVSRFLFASTGDAQNALDPSFGGRDDTPMPASAYAACKACGELLVHSYAGLISTAVLRFHHPYGPGGDRFLVNRLVHAVRHGLPVERDGPEGIEINPVWVEDLAVGVCAAVGSLETGMFDLAGPETVSLRELVILAGELLGVQPVVHVRPGAPSGTRVGNIERAERLLGFRPGVAVREGIGGLIGKATETAR